MFKQALWCVKHLESLPRHPQKPVRNALHTLSVTNSDTVRLILLNGLKDVIARKSLEDGKQIHDEALQSGLSQDMVVSSTLVNMYFKCGGFKDACSVFKCMCVRDVVAWNVMIAGYSTNGLHKEAIAHFWDMNRAGVKPTKITFVNVLKACTESESLKDGMAIHATMEDQVTSDIFLGSVLVGMYAKCGCIEKARQLFNKMEERDGIAWNVMIGGYAQSGKVQEAMSLFEQMQKKATLPDTVTFVNVLKACINATSLESGQAIHTYMAKCGVNTSFLIGSSLVDMYAKCGSILDARAVFDELPSRDVVMYNVMIAGYAQERLGDEAFKLLSQIDKENLKPDRVTFLCLLKACIGLSSLDLGKQAHVHIIYHGYGLDTKVMNTVIDMYAKCGVVAQARQVFDVLPKDCIVTWTAMIACYVHHRQFDEAFALFWQMQVENLQLNEAAYVIALKACAQTGALETGLEIHELIKKNGFQMTILVESALVDMYCKCGSVKRARQVFDEMPTYDAISWTSMLTGYAQHGHGPEALEIAKKMLSEGFKVDRITAVAILSACNHMGQVDVALSFFNSMTSDHGIVPSSEHYACMVDLLGRAGHLDKVDDLLKKMPRQPNAIAWTSSLGACGVHGNVDMAKHASESLHSVEPQSTAAFVLLSNMCARPDSEESLTGIEGFENGEGICDYAECG